MASPTTAASVKNGATTIAEVANASFTLNKTMIDITGIGDAHFHHEPGLLGGTATVELFYGGATGQAGLIGAFKNGTLLNEAEIIWATGKSVKGKAYVQDWTMNIAPNGVAMATCTLLFSKNALTIVE